MAKRSTGGGGKKSSGGTRSKRKTTSGEGQTCAEVMTRDPVELLESETVLEAARVMRDQNIGDVIVLDDTGGRIKGIVTDRDVVVRAVANGQDLAHTTLSSICSEDLVCVGPGEPIDKVVQLMRDKAIRRMPVVEDEHAVGIISIGDLAERLDRQSALADISSAPPND